MTAVADRIAEPLTRIVKGGLPGVDYLGWYRARVVRQALSTATRKMTVDVVPDDKRIPPLSAITLKLGLPGADVQISPGAYVLVGWENGDPAKPQAALWDGGEADPIKVVLNAVQLFLGTEAGAEPPIKGITAQAQMTALLTALTAYIGAIQAVADPTHVATTALATAISAFLSTQATALATRARVG